MIRNLIAFFVFAFIVLLGAWIHLLRSQIDQLTERTHKLQSKIAELQNQNTKLEDRVEGDNRALSEKTIAASQTRAQVQGQIGEEQRRLNEMRKRLAQLMGTTAQSGDDPDFHIPRAQAEVDRLQKLLAGLNDDNRTIDQRSKQFLAEQSYDREKRKLALQGQIQLLNSQIHDTNEQIKTLNPQARKNPTVQAQIADLKQQIEAWKTQKIQDETARKAIDLEARRDSQQVAGEVNSEKFELSGEKEKTGRELATARADLARWQKTKADRASKAKNDTAAVTQVKRDISAEEAKVSDLQRLLSTIPEK